MSGAASPQSSSRPFPGPAPVCPCLSPTGEPGTGSGTPGGSHQDGQRGRINPLSQLTWLCLMQPRRLRQTAPNHLLAHKMLGNAFQDCLLHHIPTDCCEVNQLVPPWILLVSSFQASYHTSLFSWSPGLWPWYLFCSFLEGSWILPYYGNCSPDCSTLTCLPSSFSVVSVRSRKAPVLISLLIICVKKLLSSAHSTNLLDYLCTTVFFQ